MQQLAALHARGARHFRFVDRTFNLKSAVGSRILEFFLERLDDSLFVTSVIPDHLPDKLKAVIAKFPREGCSSKSASKPETGGAALISRRQTTRRRKRTRVAARESNALLHVDLIAGLPTKISRASDAVSIACMR